MYFLYKINKNEKIRTNDRSGGRIWKIVRHLLTNPSTRSMSSLSCYNPALESAVDAYASRLLRLQSAQEAAIDPSVGPYVTSVIRSSLNSDVALSSVSDFSLESMIEYDSLIELIQDHCGMDPEVSREVLRRIAMAVCTGVVTECEESTHTWNTTNSSISTHEHNTTSYGYRPDVDHASPQDTNMWNNRFYETLNASGTNSSSVHLGGIYSSDGDKMIPSAYMEDYTIFRNEVKYTNQGVADEQKFVPSLSFSESDFSSNRVSPPSSKYSCDDSMFPSSSIIEPHRVGESSIIPSTDHLIPIELLGVIEDATKQSTSMPKEENAESSISNNTPPPHLQEGDGKGAVLCEYAAVENEEKSSAVSGNKIKGKKGKNKATEIAALLFKPSRPRSNSVQEMKSPKLHTPSLPLVPSLASLSFSNGAEHYLNHMPGSFTQNFESSTQILLSLNPTICEEAAYEASLIADTDINLAQHVIDGALSAPPVCRHMLNDSCYRSDCQFSHDVDGHTCLFWLKGRCGKGDGCRFLHGFSQKLLDDVKVDYLPEYMRTATGIEAGKTLQVTNRTYATQSTQNNQSIQTANLVQHNMKTSLTTATRQALNRTGSFDFHSTVNSFHGDASDDKTSSILFHSSMWKASSNSSPSITTYISNKEANISSAVISSSSSNSTKTNALNSFASIASNGYRSTSFSYDHVENYEYSTSDNSFVRIPQDLWHANDNRSSAAFQIAEPIARYSEVSRSVMRDDIIDLHFQSLKTFPIVLSQILPEKLRSYKEVWIISGSGHHVSRNSHQKSGGVLDNAVIEWLTANEYNFTRGKDKNGFGGAVLVKR